MADLNLATCFQYPDALSGDLVIKASTDNYVIAIGNKVCNLITAYALQQNALMALSQRMSVQENKQQQVYVLPSIKPVYISDPNTALKLDVFVKILESKVFQEISALGDSTDIYESLSTQPANFNKASALGVGGGTMDGYRGWESQPSSLAQSFSNLWLTVLDLRNAFSNIKLSLPSLCERLTINFTTTYQNRILKLFFAGTVPAGFLDCVSGNVFIVKDQSGNYINLNGNIIGNMNAISGVSYDLTASPLNAADDLDISSTACFTDSVSSTTCQKYLSAYVTNSSTCPSVTLNPGFTTVGFSFNHSGGILTYSVELWDASNTLVQTLNYAVNAATVINGSFSSLVVETSYKIRLSMILSNGTTKSCQFTSFSTLNNPCPAPNSITVTLEY